MNKGTTDKREHSRWHWLYRITGAAALISGAVMVIGVMSLAVTILQISAGTGWLAVFQDIWLIVIFKLQAGFRGVQLDRLSGLNLLDLVFLGLAGVVHVGLYTALRRTSRVWSIVAAVQPWLGIALFIATNTAGRSAVMGAALVASLVMLGNALFGTTIAYVGILASALLLAGDFSAGVIPPSALVATLFGIGYVLLATWFFVIGGALMRLGSGAANLQPQ